MLNAQCYEALVPVLQMQKKAVMTLSSLQGMQRRQALRYKHKPELHMILMDQQARQMPLPCSPCVLTPLRLLAHFTPLAILTTLRRYSRRPHPSSEHSYSLISFPSRMTAGHAAHNTSFLTPSGPVS